MAKAADLVVLDWSNQSSFTLGTGVTVSGTNLVIPADAAYPSAFAATTWDLTESHFTGRLLGLPNTSNGSTNANIGVYLSSGNDAYFGWENGVIRVAIGAGGTWTYHGYITYSATDHAYLRIRETAGTLYFEGGPDPETFPTLFHSTPNPWAMTAISPYVGAGNWNGATDPGSATWGTINETVAPEPEPEPDPTGPRAGTSAFLKQSDGSWQACNLRILPWVGITGNWQNATVDVNPAVRAYATSTHASTAGTETATRPAAEAGDLLVLYTLADSGTSASIVVPPEFTELSRVIGNPGVRYVVSYRVAGASEPTTYTYGSFPAANGASMILSVKDWDGSTANLRSAISSATNTTMDAPSLTPATSRSLLLTGIATDDDAEPWTWGWRPPITAGAVGYVHNADYWCSGSVAQEIVTGTGATGTRTWAVTTSSTQTTRMTSALTIGAGTATKTLTQFLAGFDTTAGEGGELTDRTEIPFEDSAGLSSTYHLYADGLDWTKSVGLLIYTDGSGDWGLNNPTDPYLMGGANGMIAVAKRQNMVLLTPKAPGTGCLDGDGVCWYMASENGVTAEQKLEWSNELIRDVLTRYDIDRRRIAFGGYSSGAQWTTGWWGPKYASEIVLDGVAVAISYGGPPRSQPKITADYKAAVEYVWDVGTTDTSYTQPTWDDSIPSGRAWYQDAGFAVTDLITRAGGHDRSDFGTVMETAITTRVLDADGNPPANPMTPVSLRAVSTVNRAGGTTSTAISRPAGTTEGDLLLYVLATYGTNAANSALPAGFTQVAAHARNTSHYVRVGYKVATGSEPASYTPTVTGGNACRGDLMAYANVDVSRMPTVPIGSTPASSTVHNAPSITAPTDNGKLVCLVSGGGGNLWTPPSGMTEVTDAQTAASYYLTLSTAEEHRTAAGATGTRTFGGGGGNFSQTTASLFLPSVGSA